MPHLNPIGSLGWLAPRPAASIGRLEHFPEKWIPVFRKEMRQTSNLKRFPCTAPAVLWSTYGKRSRARRGVRDLWGPQLFPGCARPGGGDIDIERQVVGDHDLVAALHSA